MPPRLITPKFSGEVRLNLNIHCDIKLWYGNNGFVFLGAKAPLGLVTVSQSVSNKKVGKCKISQDLNSKQYTLISYSPLWTFDMLRVTTARDGHLPSLGWSPTHLKLVTNQKEYLEFGT